MRVLWLLGALRDMASIGAYISADDPEASRRMLARLRRAAEGLTAHPRRGRPGRSKGTRELVVAGTAYILKYRVRGDSIQIVRVVQGRQLWPM